MGKLLVLILLLVVMGHGPAALGGPIESRDDIISAPRNIGPGMMGTDSDGSAVIRRTDEDHSNVDLDKLAAYRYDVEQPDPVQVNNELPIGGEITIDNISNNNLARLLAKMNIMKRTIAAYPAELSKDQWERKFQQDSTREDKDYTFVGLPPTNRRPIGARQQLEGRDTRIPLKLRDLLLSNALRFASDRQKSIEKPDTLIQAAKYNQRVGSDLAPHFREKKRRCNVGQPNMGVKNQSFCDTDAYFGAADYSMRDVWDSAGR